MKSLGMGAKIVLGFGMLLVIAGILGGIGVWNMAGVKTENEMLANEYVPEVDVAVELRGAANRVMYEMRGYGFTENEQFYKDAQKELKAVDTALEKARELAKRAKHLKQLSDQVEVAGKAIEDYKSLAAQTQALNNKLAKNREILDAAAAKYMQNSNDFLKGQNEKFKTDLNERQKKIELATQLVGIGSTARVSNFKSQASNDAELMNAAIREVEAVHGVINALRKITRDEEDLQRIDKTDKAAENYQEAMRGYLNENNKGTAAKISKLEKNRHTMDTNAGIYVKNCDEFLAGQQKKLQQDMLERLSKITIVNDIIDLGNETRIGAFKSQALRDPKVMRTALKNFPLIGDKFQQLRTITRLKEDLDRIDKVEAAGNNYKTGMEAFLNNWLALESLGAKRETAGQSVINACKTTADAGMESTDRIAKGAQAALSNATTIMIIGLFIALALGVAVAILITRSITGPINRVIDTLNEASDQVASASGQVSSSSQHLAEGSSEQAASIEETSSSLEEMASMTKQNAENAGQADNLMREANQVVKQANMSMNQLTASMGEISKASEETSKIIKTIDEIAFQTNLLALNAAVEAARAGEAGAGFAVVADEVRNLAMRAAEAAKNTAGLIEGTVKKVGDGSELVTKTNDAFEQVATSAKKVGELVGEIAAASKEQSQGIDQLNIAVNEMDKVVQQNAANAEESASASEEMNAQAEQMKEAVGSLLALVGRNGHTNGNGAKFYTKAIPQHAVVPGLSPSKSLIAKQHENPSKIIPLDDGDFKDF